MRVSSSLLGDLHSPPLGSYFPLSTPPARAPLRTSVGTGPLVWRMPLRPRTTCSGSCCLHFEAVRDNWELARWKREMWSDSKFQRRSFCNWAEAVVDVRSELTERRCWSATRKKEIGRKLCWVVSSKDVGVMVLDLKMWELKAFSTGRNKIWVTI